MGKFALSRRCLLAAAALGIPAGRVVAADLTGPLTPEARRRLVLERRDELARAEMGGALATPTSNGDEDRYADRRVSTPQQKHSSGRSKTASMGIARRPPAGGLLAIRRQAPVGLAG